MSSEFSSCLEKQVKIADEFKTLKDPQEKYGKIISLGKKLPQLCHEYHQIENKVSGCQSTLYIHGTMKEGNIYFEVFSDALISRGLAYLLIETYNGESPEVILKCPPNFVNELQLEASLSPGRLNGMGSLLVKMRQIALKLMTQEIS